MDDLETTSRLHDGKSGTWHVVHRRNGRLKLRVWEQWAGTVEGFTKRYGVKCLVWFEFQPDFPSAIPHEKQLKKWNRAWGWN